MTRSASLADRICTPARPLAAAGRATSLLQALADAGPHGSRWRALQRLADGAAGPLQAAERPNRTGLPDGLKSGVEALSGQDLSDVRVHANSSQPAQVGALAFAQGNAIHVGPGQERHLAHEAWHVVQQRQGRVAPTGSVAGVAVNDDPGLEREADVMGARANGVGQTPSGG